MNRRNVCALLAMVAIAACAAPPDTQLASDRVVTYGDLFGTSAAGGAQPLAGGAPITAGSQPGVTGGTGGTRGGKGGGATGTAVAQGQAPGRPGVPAGPGAGRGRGPGQAAAAPAPGANPQAPPTGKGVTETEIRIGFQVAEDLQAGFAAVGADGDAPDEKTIISALVKWANANGGIAGRQIKPVFHGTSATSGTWSTQAQAACSTFTEDNEVLLAASSPVGGSDALAACMAQKQTPLIENNLWLFDTPYYQRYAGYLYQPSKMRPDRWGVAYVDGLHDAGYFKGATLGLIRFDAPVFERISNNVVKPRLAKYGVKVEEEVALSTPASVSDFGRMNGEINNAILRFRQAGVDHVMMIENAGILPFFFMPQAESSGYRPRYGLTSNDIPNTMAGQAPEEQLRNAVGVGWTPPNEVRDFAKTSAASALCSQIMKEAGINAAGFYTHIACDTIFFLRTVVPRMVDWTPQALATTVAGLKSYDSPFTFSTSYGPSKFDGANAYRVFAFDNGCTCFGYSGPLKRAP